METNIYRDIAQRTGGDIYIGVVGPVRSGKSTFIKSFMEEMVIPKIDDIYLKERARDELPQSGSGRTIMTAEPKFVPEEAVCISLDNKCSFNVRMIDCVGYMIPGAVGEFENDTPRMITTSWFDHEIPLAQAAEVGTRKVICEHSTVGIVVTTDGSVGDIGREDYVSAEERIISELKDIKKPFCVLLNCADPKAAESIRLQDELSEKYKVPCKAVNCMSVKSDEIDGILSDILHQFPVKEYSFSLPEWIMYLPEDNELRKEMYNRILATCENAVCMEEACRAVSCIKDGTFISDAAIKEIDSGKGCIYANIEMPADLFYKTLSEYSGITVNNEGHLMEIMRETAKIRAEYAHISGALEQVRQTGYGIVMPAPHELTLEQPEIIKQGGRSGVRLKASAPSIHLMRADIETEINPIVGSEKQSEDLVQYLLAEFEDSPEKIWDTNIFGKSLSELVNEGLNNKLYKMPDEARAKLRQTLERVINEGSGGLICIIL